MKRIALLLLLLLVATPCEAIERNVASQAVKVLAWDTSANAPKTGDAGNIAVYLSKDSGAVTQLTDNGATEDDATNAPGVYEFDLTQTETNAATLSFSGKSSTANVEIIPFTVATVPSGFGNLNVTTLNTLAGHDPGETIMGATDLGDGSGLTEAGGTGDHFTAIPWNAAWDAEAQSEAADALVAYDPPTRTEATSDKAEILAGTYLLRTTVTGVSSQQIFQIATTSMPGVNDFKNCIAVFRDAGSNDWAVREIDNSEEQPGGTETEIILTTAVDEFTVATSDVVYIYPPSGLAPDVIDSGKIAANSLGASEVADGAIDAGAIASGAITGPTFDGSTAYAQTGDGYAILNDGTHGLAALKSLIDALSGAYVSDSGTAQAGASGTITLRSAAVATDDWYNYQIIELTGGTGAGQSRIITDYVGATRVASVNGNWVTAPDNTTTYNVKAFGQIPGATAPTAGEVADEVADRFFTDDSGYTSADFAEGSWGKELKDSFVSGAVAINVDGSGRVAMQPDQSQVTDFGGLTILGGVDVSGATVAASGDWNTVTPLDAAGTRAALGMSAANLDTQLSGLPAGVWGSGTRSLTDKNGFALSAAGIDSIWDEPQSGHATAGTYGLFVDSSISGVSTGGVSAGDIADAVWDEPKSGHATADTYGAYLDGAVSDIEAVGGGATAQEVWEYGGGRTVTQNPAFSLQQLFEADLDDWDNVGGSVGAALANTLSQATGANTQASAAATSSATAATQSTAAATSSATAATQATTAATESAAANTKAADIQSRLPAALVGGKMDSAATVTLDSGDIDDLAAQLIAGGVGGAPISPKSWSQAWRFDSPFRVTASNTVTETTEFDGIIAMDFSNVLPKGTRIYSIGTVTITPTSGTEPLLGTATVDPTNTVVLLDTNIKEAGGASTPADVGSYTIAVPILTTDSQNISRKGLLDVQ